MKRMPWIVWALLVPPYAVFMLACYWYFFDTESPLVINYSHPLFTSSPARSRDEAKAKEITAVIGGATVWTYRELCVVRDIPGTLRARWDAEAFSWTVADVDFLPSPIGCHRAAYAVPVPTSNPTRNVLYKTVRDYAVNPLKTISVPAAPIPLTILANK